MTTKITHHEIVNKLVKKHFWKVESYIWATKKKSKTKQNKIKVKKKKKNTEKIDVLIFLTKLQIARTNLCFINC